MPMCLVFLKTLRGIYLSISIVSCFFHPLLSQEKLEKEYRLHREEIPLEVITYVDSMNFQNKIKWYKEEGLQAESIEAKTKRNGKKYSIEFDTKGNIEDIEIETAWDQIPEKVKKNINSYLDSLFDKHKICKIQSQYSGQKENLLILVSKDTYDIPHILKYEIVLKGKNNLGKHLYEFLFSEEGVFEKKSKIIFRSTDNMEF